MSEVVSNNEIRLKMPVNQYLLNKYFNGLCSEQERKIVLDWLLDPKNEPLAQTMMREQWATFSENEDEVDIEMILSKTRARLNQNVLNRDNRRKIKWFEMVSVRLAASLLLIFVSLAVLLSVLKWDVDPELSFLSKTQQVQTSTGQIILKVLPDGTRVWLNAQSTLEYPSNFGKTREVELKGEAFFDVVKDKDHPFLVRAGGITISVLGTTFNIKSYPGDPSIATTLVEGKVLIQKEKGQSSEILELSPNQQAVFSHNSKDIALVNVDAQRYASWIDGSLVFEHDLVYDVFKTLERWYGVNIQVEDKSNLACRLTARIDKESLTETLELLRSITGIRYSMEGNEVTIEGKVCMP